MGFSSNQPMPLRSNAISLWLKIPYAIFVCVQFPVYWVHYGPAHFLWGSNIALLVTFVALWTENRLLPSMMAVGVLLIETGWILDFAVRLVFGEEAIALGGTQYMFNAENPLWIRCFSLYHIALPLILLWLVYQLGYHRRALLWQTLLTWLVLPLSYLFGEPSASINFVYGIGHEPQTAMPSPLYVALLMVILPVALFLPTHLLLSRWFPEPHERAG